MSRDPLASQQSPASPGDRQTLRHRPRWSSLEDEELVCAVHSGSSGALAALYDRYRMRAYRVAYSVCEDTRRAEEAVAAAFGSIARVRSGGGHPSHGTIAASLLAEVNRRATDFAPGAGDLRHPLASLPRAEREAIVLAHYGVLSAAEIAGELEVPVGVVKGRLRSGLEMLRDDEEPGSG